MAEAGAADDKAKPRFYFRHPHKGTYADVAMRTTLRAVLPRASFKEAVVTLPHVEAVLACWHGALAGLTGVLPESKLARLLRCPPVGIEVSGGGFRPQTCHMSHFCPYCWGRRAANTWKMLDLQLFPKDPKTGVQDKKMAFDLIKICSVIRAPQSCCDPVAGIDTLSSMAAFDVRAGKKKTSLLPLGSRKAEMRRLDCLAGVEIMSCDIEGKENRWAIHINQLLVVPARSRVALPSISRIWQGSRMRTPTRKTFADVLSEVYRYPDHLLRATPAQQRFYLDTMVKRRAVEHYGFARQSKKAELAALEAE